MVEWTVQKMRFKNLLRLAGIVILFVGLWHLLAPVTPMPTWTAYAELVPTIPGRQGFFIWFNAGHVFTMAIGAMITWFV